MSQAIYDIVNRLPKHNITTLVLSSLDFVVPGQWENITNFEEMIKKVTRETDEDMIQRIGERAVWLYNDKTQGYQTALWIYQTVDSADSALGAAALANKVGSKIGLLGLLKHLTPNSEKAQALDLVIKIVAELIAFCQINGLPGDSIGDFVAALREYEGESLMRMSALICLDGLIPFGPDFILQVESIINNISTQELSNNPVFAKISKLVPGGNPAGQLNFISSSFASVKGWMSNFVRNRHLTRESVMQHLHSFVEFSDEQLDYLAAFLDMSTNYFEHTGTQSIATQLIKRAMAEV
jgi:hypothetical protein